MVARKKKAVVKEEEVVEDKEKALKTAEAAIRKQFGEGAMVFLSDYQETELDVIPTGSIGLDSALGVGGLTKRKMVEVFGNPGSGKTTIAMSTAVKALRANPEEKIIFVDVEKSFSKELGLAMGLEESRTAILSLPTAEENLEAAEVLIKTGQFGICIVDSIAALTPRTEYDADLSEQQMGLHARLMSKMCRNMKPLIHSTNTMLLLINQTREKIGGYGNPMTTTGGNAIPFYADIRIKVSGGQTKSSLIKAGGKDGGEVIGHKMTFEVIKNKLAPPFRKGEVDLIYGAGFDNFGELADLGEQMGVVDRSGGWFLFDDKKFQGKDRLKNALVNDQELCSLLESEIKKIVYR